MQYRVDAVDTHGPSGHLYVTVSVWHGEDARGPANLTNDFLISFEPDEKVYVEDDHGRRKTASGKSTKGWQEVDGEWQQVDDPADPWVLVTYTADMHIRRAVEQWLRTEGLSHSGDITSDKIRHEGAGLHRDHRHASKLVDKKKRLVRR